MAGRCVLPTSSLLFPFPFVIPAKAGNPVNRIRYLSKFRDHFTLLAIRAWCDALPPLRRLEKSHRTRRGNPVGSVNPILG